MSRTGWKALVAVCVLSGAAVAFLFIALKPIHEHRRWYDRVSVDLFSLADKRPPDVPPGQWEFMVSWTINLHGNCGSSHTSVDPDQMWPFQEELERRLEGPVTVATIDWIWDEYVRITKVGRRYEERYRPTHSPDLQNAQPGQFGIRVK